MKRSLFVVAIASLCSLPVAANAQGLGVLGGWSYGQVPGTNATGAGAYTANSGFAIGLGAETGGVIGFGINGLYSQRGFKNATPGFSQKLSYIDVPLYLRISIPNPVVVPFALAGPQISFEMNCDAGGTDCPSGRSKTQYSAIAAVGVRFPMLAGLSVQGRYIYALQDLNYGTVNNQSNYRDRSFALLLGLGF
jgi:hypothetical protein